MHCTLMKIGKNKKGHSLKKKRTILEYMSTITSRKDTDSDDRTCLQIGLGLAGSAMLFRFIRSCYSNKKKGKRGAFFNNNNFSCFGSQEITNVTSSSAGTTGMPLMVPSSIVPTFTDLVTLDISPTLTGSVGGVVDLSITGSYHIDLSTATLLTGNVIITTQILLGTTSIYVADNSYGSENPIPTVLNLFRDMISTTFVRRNVTTNNTSMTLQCAITYQRTPAATFRISNPTLVVTPVTVT